MKQFMLLAWIDHSVVSCKMENLNYYFKYKGQLYITGRLWCDFIIYTDKDICVERILNSGPVWMQNLLTFTLTVLPVIVHHKGVNAVAALKVE